MAVCGLLVVGLVVGVATPGHAVHGCVLTNPSAGPVPDNPNVGPSECTFLVTAGGAYNVSVAAQAWSVVVKASTGAVKETFTETSSGNVNRVPTNAVAGDSIEASVTNGVLVVGCSTCDPPA